MIGDPHTIPDDLAARVARLINEAEDMRQQAADDLKQIYADLREELRGLGWDGKHASAEVAALKGAIGEMRLDDKAKEKREEKSERVDDYVSLLTRARARGEHKNDRREGESNAKLIATVATGMQTETGRKALVTALDIMIEREEAEEQASDGSPSVSSSLTTREAEESVVSVSEKATVATQGEATEPTSAEREDRAAANAGGDHVTSIAQREVEFDRSPNTGEGAASALPAKSQLRPHCQRPGNTCGGYGDKHCHDCLRAMRESEAA